MYDREIHLLVNHTLGNAVSEHAVKRVLPRVELPQADGKLGTARPWQLLGAKLGPVER